MTDADRVLDWMLERWRFKLVQVLCVVAAIGAAGCRRAAQPSSVAPTTPAAAAPTGDPKPTTTHGPH